MIESWSLIALLLAPTSPGSPQGRDTAIARIRSLGEEGRFFEGEELLGESLKNPLRHLAVYQLGRDWMREFRFEAAVWIFEAFWKAQPDSSNSWMNYAISLRQSGRNDEAEKVLRGAISRFPSEGLFHDELALLGQALGRDDLAEEGFLASRERGTWDAGENLAILRMVRKDPQGAKKALEEVLRHDPSRRRARVLFGFLRLD